MHRLLSRQLQESLGKTEGFDEQLQHLLDAVDCAYRQADEGRALLERSMELSSRALLERNQELTRAELNYRAIFENATEGIFQFTPDGKVISANPALAEIFGYDSPDQLKRCVTNLSAQHYADPALQSQVLANIPMDGSPYRYEAQARRRDGSFIWTSIVIRAVLDEEGTLRFYEGSLADITDRRTAEQRLRFDALHDSLTGLANRALLLERLSHCLARSRRDASYTFAVLFLDVDHFKVINDSLGHIVGDKLLSGIGRRLTACAREIDTVARSQSKHVARIGGDEFVLLLEELRTEADALRVAERVLQSLSAPFHIDEHEIVTRASVGLALSDARYERPEELLRDADTAMYQAKNAGKGCARIFDPQMHERAMTRWRTENELRRAIENDELVVHYQPIMTADGQVATLEALVRWQHSSGQLIMPNDFVPIAEETGLIVPLGRCVLRMACRQLRRWQEQFPSLSELTIGVNVSGRQFALSTFADDITRVLDETELPAQCLRLEITETTAMQKADATVQILTQLRELGVLFYMDDFGTGYSSLSYLHKMPIDALKIDRAFVGTMETDPVSRSIVQAVISLSQSLGMHVIAEGVETAEQLAALRHLGCEFVQGFLFCRPLEVRQMTNFLAACEQQALAATA